VLFEAKDARAADALVAKTLDLLKAHASTHGLIDYALGRQADGKFALVEHWPDEEHFMTFARTAEFQAFMGEMMEFLAAPPTGGLYEIFADATTPA
jgi:quinol monooxygenase YgiN